jgi:predicted nuclease of predicted toxin-antitoxin system
MQLTQILFLLDENVDQRIKVVFNKLHLKYSTVQQEGWSGIKNGQLSQRVKQNNLVLITRDKDFTFLWKKFEIRIIYLAIEPPNFQNIIKELEMLFQNWNIDLNKSFLVTLQKDSVRLWIQ